LRVLIAEDNLDCAETTAMLLRHHGHHAQVATDGFTALELARAERPDVVLLDIRLPGMDGWTVASQIRKYWSHDKPLLIAVTGMARDEDRQHSAESGIDLHLTKPVDPERLNAMLDCFARN
jgi:DNA-binding response OmpR family regulator